MSEFLTKFNKVINEFKLNDQESLELLSFVVRYSKSATRFLPIDTSKWDNNLIQSAFEKAGVPNMEILAESIKNQQTGVDFSYIESITKEILNVGNMGHTSHGKTTLTSAITKVASLMGQGEYIEYEQIQNIPEEIERGITIKVAEVEYETETRHYNHLDMPGHEDYIKNTIVGISRVDAAIIVVSATEGPMPQTVAHLQLAHQIGLNDLIVFLNKMDIVDDQGLLEAIEIELEIILDSFDFKDTPIIKGSARDVIRSESDNPYAPEYSCIRQLLTTMDEEFSDVQRDYDKPFLMPIAQVSTRRGIGTIVTGLIEQGQISVREPVAIVGMRDRVKKSTVKGINVSSQPREIGRACETVEILMRGAKKIGLERGMVLAKPNTLKSYRKFLGRVYLCKSAEGGRPSAIVSGYKPQFHIRTMGVTGEITLLQNRKSVLPGETVALKVELLEPAALYRGVKFAIREGHFIIGSGIVTGLE